jgi:hypothetical protein
MRGAAPIFHTPRCGVVATLRGVLAPFTGGVNHPTFFFDMVRAGIFGLGCGR